MHLYVRAYDPTVVVVCVCVLPDTVVEGEVTLPEAWLCAQGEVDLHVAVLHPPDRQLVLRAGQLGRQRQAVL